MVILLTEFPIANMCRTNWNHENGRTGRELFVLVIFGIKNVESLREFDNSFTLASSFVFQRFCNSFRLGL